MQVFRFLIGLLSVVVVKSSLAFDVPNGFELSVVGELVDQLEAGTVVTVSTLGTSEKSPCMVVSGRIEDLPLTLPVADFQNRYTQIYFRSPTLKANVFSMEMDADLLDQPRPIKLLLNRPTVNLRTMTDWNAVRFTASVSQRMRYLDLPYRDAKSGKLVPMPAPPELRYAIGDQPKRSVKLGSFCMGFKWYGRIPRDHAPRSNTNIRYTVSYDSGAAFGMLRSGFSYDFRVDRN